MKKEIDWEQRRYEIAKEVLAGSLSGVLASGRSVSEVELCTEAIDFANILTEKLKERYYNTK